MARQEQLQDGAKKEWENLRQKAREHMAMERESFETMVYQAVLSMETDMGIYTHWESTSSWLVDVTLVREMVSSSEGSAHFKAVEEYNDPVTDARPLNANEFVVLMEAFKYVELDGEQLALVQEASTRAYNMIMNGLVETIQDVSDAFVRMATTR